MSSETPPPPTTTMHTVVNDPLPGLFHTAAITFAIASPILILLPPRKLDFYTASLAGTFCLSANYITRERTGKSILQHLDFSKVASRNDNTAALSSESRAIESVRGKEGQFEARRQQEELRALRQRALGLGADGQAKLDNQQPVPESKPSRTFTNNDDREHEGGIAGMAKKVWMGEEKEDWKEKRIQEEKEALEEGKSYADLIVDQIWEVWNWGRKDAPASPREIKEEQLKGGHNSK